MRLAALFSGGKDSACAVHRAALSGHEVCCLVTVVPGSYDSHLLHYPNLAYTGLQARAMGLPQIMRRAGASETRALAAALAEARELFGVQGVCHGGISSGYQRDTFRNLGLDAVAPLWGEDSASYMRDLVQEFEFVITDVASAGLDGSWLGRVPGSSDVERMIGLSERYGFNANFEGGEAETFALGGPPFRYALSVEGRISYDGYRGRFEITAAYRRERC